ncbi:MAG TPA: hypothetical protein VJ782_05085 [Aeromicrobium sp.]|nr:hypothetical protein [Aeromicrobium sp.]
MAAALRELTANRHAPLRDADPEPEGDGAVAGELDEPGQEDTADQPIESSESEDRETPSSAHDDAPSLPSWAGVQTAAMLAEPEDVKPPQSSVGQALPPPLRPERDKAEGQDRGEATVQKSALQRAKERVGSHKAEPKKAGSSSPETAAADIQAATARTEKVEQTDEVRAAVERAEAAERSARELESTVSALKAELEQARAEATAAGVALERVEREAKEQVGAAAIAQADAAQADSLRLASDLATNLQRQEAMIAALAGLQAEVTEQRAWFEAQIANRGEAESQQASVIAALEAAVRERDIELEALRQHLLEAEAKRAEEAAAFVAALERQ